MELSALVRRIAEVHHTRALEALVVRASDEPIALSGRRDAIRVLLIGSGVTTGWGVHTHGLALVGSLQRELQVTLKRPVDVEQLHALGASLATATGLLGERAAEEWDVIVVAFGVSDAMSLTPVQDWAHGLSHLLARLDGDMPRGLLIPIVVAGVPPMHALGALQLLPPLRVVISRHGERLNAATRALVARNRRATFVPLSGLANSSDRPAGSPEAYGVWAEEISATVAEVLPPDARHLDVETIASTGPEDLAAAVLAPRNTAVRTALRGIVERMADEYTADLVLLNIARGDELWTVARSGSDAVESMKRDSTLSDATMRAGVLHLPDVAAHPRLDGITSRGVSSYAGRAVRNAAGEVVGNLSIVNGSTSGPTDFDLLREFGAAIESQLALLDRCDASTGGERLRPAGVQGEEDAAAQLPPAADAAVAALRSASDDGGTGGAQQRRPRGPLGRHRRLQREGRLLTEVAAVRAVPPETDLWVPGADPLRVLVIGGEYSVGFGAKTRAEALDGALARLLHTRTGRGVLVENRSLHQVRLHQLAASLGPAGAATFDLVVWTPTFIEGARLLFRSRWLAGIELLLRRIEATSTASVLLVGYPSLLGSQPLAVLGRRRAGQINRLLRRVAALHARVRVAEPPAIDLKHVESADGPRVYREAAVRIFSTAIDLVERHADDDRSGRGAPRVGPTDAVQELVDA